MKKNSLVSIIINNYNYERFLRSAVDSALSQTYSFTEVIIVDDGSTDHSATVLNEYKAKAEVVMKENGGQGSAFNAGFEVSKGEFIIYLDADDCLLPEAAEMVVNTFDNDDLSKVHWPLYVIGENGERTGKITPDKNLLSGDLLNKVLESGPNSYVSPPTSGNAWSRKFLEKVLLMPESAYKISADNYLCMLAPLYGNIKTIEQPLGLYRLHGKNNFRGKNIDEALLQSKVDRYEEGCRILENHLQQKGIEANISQWNNKSWLKKLQHAINDIKKFVPESASFILADENQWQVQDSVAGRKVILFKEHNSVYWGPPHDDADAIAEIEKQVKDGSGFIFFAWPAFWLLEHYKQMRQYLHNNYECVIDDERLKGFNLIKAHS